MPFDPTKPAHNSPNSSTEMRDQRNVLKALIDALQASHSHGLPLNLSSGNALAGADVQVFPPGNYTSDPASSFPPYYEVVWVMRVR
ncbi:MAG TPA: hypothetical protein VGF13_04920 [Verrucomicrobiae bacterium]|jgi:hypothetical protein